MTNNKVKMTKDKLVKFVKKEDIRKVLLKDGWKLEEVKAPKKDNNSEERGLLVEKANKLGVKFQSNIGNVKLLQKIEDAEKALNSK